MPIYSEPQVKAPNHNAFAANTVINFLCLNGARTYFFCAKTGKYAPMAQPGLNTDTAYGAKEDNRVFFPCCCATGVSFPGGASHGLLSLLVLHRVFFLC